MALAVGTRLGPYEILGPLGAGGMGEVYRARDTRLAREVAVKVLPPHLAETPEARARFEREAKAISSLNHPHICTLHDVGREGDTDYLVMELVDGETLAERITRGPVPPDEVMRIGLQVADALDKAHRQGLVHRDLKPGNVMLTRSGAKLLDFGLARSTGLGPASQLTSTPTQTRGLTTEGALVGTFQYMSPEQLEGGEADARSDVWALGVLLYEALTGRRAFAGASQAKLIGAIMNTEPPPASSVSELVPPAMDRLIKSCLAKDPDERVQTAHDVKLQLQWILEGGSQIGVPASVVVRRRHRDRALTTVAVVASAAFIALAGWVLSRRTPDPPVIRFEVSPPGSLRTVDAPRISPDGRTIAYNATDSTGTWRIWIRPLSGFEATPLAGTEGAHRPFWSPDSRTLGFVADGKLKKIDVTGGPPSVICDAPTGSDGTWGRTGVILFDGGTSDPIRRVSAAGGVAAAQVVSDSAHGATQVGWPEFLPDGRHFLYLTIGADSHLMVGSIDSKAVKDLGPCESQIKFVHPGYLLFSRAGALVAQRFNTRDLRLEGEPVPIAEQVTAGVNGASEFHASDNGVLVFSATVSQAAKLIEIDRTGRELRRFTLSTSILHPRLSPDGRRLSLRVLDTQTRSRDLWVVELDRDVSSRFTFEPGMENYPLWTRDGRSLLYWSTNTGSHGVVRKDFGGAAQPQLMVPLADAEYELSDVSPDGKYLLATVNGATRQYVALISLADRKVTTLLAGPYNVEDAMFSPDGRTIVYNSDESGRMEVYAQPWPERNDKWRISTAGGLEACWSADGRQIYYLSADQMLNSVPVRTGATFEVGTPQALFPIPVVLSDAGRPQYCPNADGSRFFALVPASYRTLPSTYVVVNWTEGLRRR